jgi:hypothetical protein
MAQRSITGATLSALAAGALGTLAPSAAAQDLAPGLSCNDQGYCRNDTNDVYHVTGQAICSDSSASPFSGDVDRHSTKLISMLCPNSYIPGATEQGPATVAPDGTVQQGPITQTPGTTTINDVVSIQWQTATRDDDRKLGPHTGSW